jgi:lipopolysaccharide/colanic/teichoic acid biosynthesis glycosyltransferase
MLARALKRAFDVVVAGTAIVAGAPLLAATAALVRADVGSPVLFRQRRGGLRGSTFEVIKFRTMRDALDAHGRALPDAERLTAIGKFLRASSLDELPQLFNVLRGDMSIVGPRPFIAQYLGLYSAEQARRHDMRPGITGLAQVEGRNALTWREKFALDVWYVDHWSLALDARLLAKTVVALALRRGISAPADATMPVWQGE